MIFIATAIMTIDFLAQLHEICQKLHWAITNVLKMVAKSQCGSSVDYDQVRASGSEFAYGILIIKTA